MSNVKPLIGVIGAGTMGSGIALSHALAGHRVVLVDQSTEALQRARTLMASHLEQLKAFGLAGDDSDESLKTIETLQGVEPLLGLDDLDMAIETVSEDLQIKREIFSALDGLTESALIASNTSSLTLSAITDGMRTPERTVGLHYFNPAHIIPAVEIHRCAQTTDEAIARTRKIIEATGKTSILVRKEIPGFVINRLTGALEREIDHLLDEGVVSPHDLDRAVKASLGFRLACLGPMEAEDMIGLDIASRVSSNLFKVLSNADEPSKDLVEKVARGELGVKSGKGWYEYPEQQAGEILSERNARLLRQLALFRQNAEKDKPS